MNGSEKRPRDEKIEVDGRQAKRERPDDDDDDEEMEIEDDDEGTKQGSASTNGACIP